MRWVVGRSASLLTISLLVGIAAGACGGSSDGPGGGGFDGGGLPCYGAGCDAIAGPGSDTGGGRDAGGGTADAAIPPDDAGSTPGLDVPGPRPETVTPGPDTGAPPECVGAGCAPRLYPEIEVDPPRELWFSYVPENGDVVRKSVTIANTGDADLLFQWIGLVANTPPDFEITQQPDTSVPLRPGQLTTVEVTFTERSRLPGDGTLSIVSNDRDERETWIRLRPQPKGPTTVPEPCIQVAPSVLDFGQVPRGQMGTKTFTITSCGTAALSVRSIERRGTFFLPMPAEFQLAAPVQAPQALPPGTSVTQAVTYAAGLAGARVGYFEIMTDDPNTPAVRVDVRGTSLAPPPETQGLHLQLDWDSDDCDVDLHLLNPQGTFFQAPNDCYYANMSPSWGVPNDIVDDPFLDVDNVWGFGPENINLQEPQPGRYKVIVHFYSDSYQGSMSTDTNARLKVYIYGTLAAEFGPTHLASTNWTWDVCTIDWPAQTITPLGNVYRR